MVREELIFVGTCDIAGHVRGKGFPASDLERRRSKGVGWTHSNLMQTAFGPILDTPFGTGGDLMIVPDPAAEVRVDFGDGSAPEHFFLGDIRNTDGSPWECCPREFLRRAIATLDDVSGLQSDRRLRAGIRLYRQSAARWRLLQPGRVPSPGYVRRELRCRHARRRRHAGLVSSGIRGAPVRGDGGAEPRTDRSRSGGDHPRDGAGGSASPWPSRVLHTDARGIRRRQRGAYPHEPAGRFRRADDLRADRTDGPQHGCAAFLCRRAGASAGDLCHHRALAGLVSTADAEPLGADTDRHPAAGSRRGVAHLPGVRRRRSSGNGAAVQPGIPRLRRRRQSVHGAGRGHLCRRRWVATQARAACVGGSIPMRSPRHSARRWMAWRQARRSPAGSARSSWRPTSVTSVRSCIMSPNGR